MEKPEDLNADFNLPCDSLIDESHKPMTEKVGIPGDIDTSIIDTVDSVPLAKQEYNLATFGFEAITDPPFQAEYCFGKWIISTK